MKFLAAFALATLAVAAPSSKRAPSPLEVKLEADGNSAVKATITNNGKNNLKVFKTGTLLDSAPVEKAQVFAGEQAIEFDGVRLRVAEGPKADDDFELIPAGESVSVSFDIAELHDLSVGGAYSIQSKGAMSFAEEDSNELTGSVPYDSNTLELDVDGAEASATRIEFHAKRTRVQSTCTGTRLTAITNALSRCASLARVGQTAAQTGAAAKVTEFFKSSTSATRTTVANVFSAVAAECGSTNGGSSTLYCSDPYGACSGGVLAYTLPSASYMAYCNLFFTGLPATATSCYGQDQGNTVLHEVTHLRQVKGTDDYGGYGYNFVRSLSAAQNLNHADTYTLFAQAVSRGC